MFQICSTIPKINHFSLDLKCKIIWKPDIWVQFLMLLSLFIPLPKIGHKNVWLSKGWISDPHCERIDYSYQISSTQTYSWNVWALTTNSENKKSTKKKEKAASFLTCSRTSCTRTVLLFREQLWCVFAEIVVRQTRNHSCRMRKVVPGNVTKNIIKTVYWIKPCFIIIDRQIQWGSE